MARLTTLDPRLLAPLSLFLLAGCPGKDDTSVDETGDTEESGSEESDSEEKETDESGGETGETGAETGAGPADGGYTSMTGTSHIVTSIEGSPGCDLSVDLVGTAYTGECQGCTFAFDMEIAGEEDNTVGGCYARPTGSFVEDGRWTSTRLVYWDEFIYNYDGYSYTYGETFYSFMDYYYPPYGQVYYYGFPIGLVFDGAPYYDGASFSFDGTNLAWSYGFSYYYYNYLPTDASVCGAVNYGKSMDFSLTGESMPGSLSQCAKALSQRDTFTFESDGSPLTVTIDTASADGAFDTLMVLTSPDGCAATFADDNWGCTFPPATYACSNEVSLDPEAGTWMVEVFSYGDCAGQTADYVLYVTGGTGITQVADDESVGFSAYQRDYDLSVTFDGVLK